MGKPQNNNDNDAPLPSTGPLLAGGDSERFLQEDLASIASNEYEDENEYLGDGSSNEGELGMDANKEAAHPRRDAVSPNPPTRIATSKFRENWMTFLMEEGDDDEQTSDDENEMNDLDEDEWGDADQVVEDPVGDTGRVTEQTNEYEDRDGTGTEMAAAAWQSSEDHLEGNLLDSVDERYRNVTERGIYTRKDEWTWKQPALEGLPDGKLKQILESEAGATIGLCFEVEPTDPPLQLSNEELSMIRLIKLTYSCS